MKSIIERPTLPWLVADTVDPEDVIDTVIVDAIRAACPTDPHAAVAALWKALRRTLATADLDTWESAGCLMFEEADAIEDAMRRLNDKAYQQPIDHSLTFAANAAHNNVLHLIDTLVPALRGEEGN